ncbi:hypothetical protein DGMP_30900 [Desulfomarina profundi]|uniref:Ice-binding protein C-terminal domain-containing protein n=1 Tax=Desulfomarina profundi TaxID=2772557 RepID=A0A8D5FIS7_9BACT|nr:PEP-CTERM sorting domain-containing protein [Desulfomarina profundi]BCL62397.1 hypothetical protein DGMP_30900 [Desulfomarina profundi]
MKNIFTAALLSLLFFSANCYALPMATDDLWDISQGSSVTGNSGILFNSNQTGMFGGYTSAAAEPPNTIFSDYQQAGTLHWIEWQTPSEITLRSFNLVAFHDGRPYDMTHRGFDTFNLLSSVDGTTWNQIYTYDTDPDGDLLYGGGVTYTNPAALELAADLSTPVFAKYFRAEFVQTGQGINGSGPRILELDGYDTFLDGSTGGDPVPEPATILLFGAGIACLGGLRLRKA